MELEEHVNFFGKMHLKHLHEREGTANIECKWRAAEVPPKISGKKTRVCNNREKQNDKLTIKIHV